MVSYIFFLLELLWDVVIRKIKKAMKKVILFKKGFASSNARV